MVAAGRVGVAGQRFEGERGAGGSSREEERHRLAAIFLL